MATQAPKSRLAVAGIIAPIWFVTLVVVQGLLQPDYSHIAMPISALAAWPLGWLQNLNFFVLAVLLATFTIAVHNVIRPTRFGVSGIVLLLASCLGLALVGAFPWINVNGRPIEPMPHVVGAILAFLTASTGMIALSRRMAADPSWRNMSAYVLVTGVAMLILFIVVGFFADDVGTPFHQWAGLLQRVLVVLWLTCTFIIARKAMGSREDAVRGDKLGGREDVSIQTSVVRRIEEGEKATPCTTLNLAMENSDD